MEESKPIEGDQHVDKPDLDSPSAESDEKTEAENRMPPEADASTPTPTLAESEPKEETTDTKLDEEKKRTPTESSDTPKAASPDNASKSSSSTSLANSSSSNCILFYGVTYLGCSSVNAPKSETEINRIMSTLNEQGKMCIEVSMSVPQTVDEKIILFDSSNSNEANSADSNANIIAEYKMAHVLFVVRGSKNSPESSCFAFTTCHGDSMENLMFSCHVFRCKLVEAVSKILYSFWSVFNRQNIQSNQQQQQQQQQSNTQPNQKQTSSKSGLYF